MIIFILILIILRREKGLDSSKKRDIEKEVNELYGSDYKGGDFKSSDFKGGDFKRGDFKGDDFRGSDYNRMSKEMGNKYFDLLYYFIYA